MDKEKGTIKINSDRELLDYIYNDVEKYDAVRRIVKANIFERTFKNKVSPKMLHANPKDEFSDPHIGPSLSIIGNYEKYAVRTDLLKHQNPYYDEPVIVEKMRPDGYMIINGHHRWAAAMKAGLKEMYIKIVNGTEEDDIFRMLKHSTHHKKAVFDFDDIVLAVGNEEKERIRRRHKLFYKHRMKLGMAAFMQALIRKGYDIWVFSSGYHSEWYVRSFFKVNGVSVTGVVSGMNQKKAKQFENNTKLADAILKQYKLVLTFFETEILYSFSEIKENGLVEIEQESYSASRTLMKKIAEIEAQYKASTAKQ